MAIKNYTTEVPAEKTVGEIQKILVNHGAKSIMIDYDGTQQPCALSFLIPTAHGELPFKLPMNVTSVAKLLEKQYDPEFRRYNRQYQEQKAAKIQKQAYKVGWRILKDWIDAQCAIIETEMVSLEEVFLGYMRIGDQSFFNLVQNKGFLLKEGTRDDLPPRGGGEIT